MKAKVNHRLVGATILIYVVGLIVGILIIWAIPYISYTSHMKTLTLDLGSDYLTGWHFDHTYYGMDYYLYSNWKTKVYSSSQFTTDSQKELIEGNLDEIFEKGSIVKPVRFEMATYGAYITSGSYWALLVGEVYTNSSGQPYASILLRVFTELDTSIMTYFVIFTLIFIAGSIYLFTYIKKSNELNMVQRDLVANVSHELKTPITTIHSMAEVLHDGMIKDAESQKQYTGMILSEADRLAGLVNDILQLSRLQSHKMEFKKNVSYADGILTPTLDRYMMLCGDTGHELNLNQLDLGIIPPLFTDDEKINTVLDVLLSNAVKYTQKGGTICVTQELHTHHVVFCVSDNGPGIDPEKLKHIFDRFYRADESRNTPGSGLGLAIADEIMKGLDEKIWVRSEVGEGSQFYFTIGYKN